MSSFLGRTRSIRKPASNPGQSGGSGSIASTDPISVQDDAGEISERDIGRTPSRLPAPPSTSGHIRTGSTSRSGPTTNGSMRPPPPRSAVSRPPLSSDNSKGHSVRSGARTPTESTHTSSRPPLTSDNPRGIPIHSGARTPTETVITTSRPPLTSANTNRHSMYIGGSTTTEPPVPNTSLQRRPSANRGTHSRQGSTTIPSSSSTSSTARSTINTKPRPQSMFLSTSAASAILRPPSQTSQTSSSTTSSRPAFSTLQQHYSPLKSLVPKPLTSSYLAPPSPSKSHTALAISAETTKLQTELLQLHLLHRDAAPVQRAYRESAKRKLGSRFRETRQRWEQVVELERRGQERVNMQALRGWLDEGGSAVKGWGAQEKVGLLGEVVTGVWNMSDAGSKYARAVKRFERWVGGVRGVLKARGEKERGEGAGAGAMEVVFVEGMEEAWKDECDLLRRKLEGWKDALRNLGTVDEAPVGKAGSSLAAVLTGCNALVNGMMSELEVMGRVERDVVQAEREWVRAMIEEGDEEEKEKEDAAKKGAGTVPAWRMA